MAQSNLGVMYARGRGVQQNWVKAYGWTQLASEQGFKTSSENLKEYRVLMSTVQIKEAVQFAETLKLSNE